MLNSFEDVEELPFTMINEEDIDKCFPFDSYRPQQREVIQGIVRSINNKVKFVIAECPTGAGKSPIAVALAKLAGWQNAYYITTTKMLQDQIEADFGSEESGNVVTLKGRNAYPCTAYEQFKPKLQTILQNRYQDLADEKPSCDEGYCKMQTARSSCKMCLPSKEDLGNGAVVFPEGINYSFCSYYEQFYGALNAQTASMNFNNFILHLNHGKKFTKRKILIIDEAHNTEDKLLGFLECTINSHHISTKVPEFKTAAQYAAWLIEIGAINILKEKLDNAIENRNMKMMSLYENLMKKYMTMIIEVREDPQGWICEYEYEPKSDTTKAILKPVFAHRAAKNYLFNTADVIIFLSATILNAKTFARNLGIEEGEYAAMRIPSTFPIKNRPIVTDYAGRFTGGKAKMDTWIKQMSKKVTEICDRYGDHKGIIHTHSFGIQKALIENLPQKVKKRLIQQFDYETKTEMIEEHAKNPGSIIIAPAMHEGVDLKDDLSRFQILCKVPFANFYDDKQLAARMEIDRGYYDYITILKIVQSVGRSIRSETDWADTFIIDESFKRVYYNNQVSFPQWFKEAVTTQIPTLRIACDVGECGCTPLTGCQGTPAINDEEAPF